MNSPIVVHHKMYTIQVTIFPLLTGTDPEDPKQWKLDELAPKYFCSVPTSPRLLRVLIFILTRVGFYFKKAPK